MSHSEVFELSCVVNLQFLDYSNIVDTTQLSTLNSGRSISPKPFLDLKPNSEFLPERDPHYRYGVLLFSGEGSSFLFDFIWSELFWILVGSCPSYSRR